MRFMRRGRNRESIAPLRPGIQPKRRGMSGPSDERVSPLRVPLLPGSVREHLALLFGKLVALEFLAGLRDALELAPDRSLLRGGGGGLHFFQLGDLGIEDGPRRILRKRNRRACA